MFKSLLNLGNKFQFNTITDFSSRNIAYRYIKKRSPFDKTNYIEDYVPRPTKYPSSRKPRLSQWDDPNFHWPPVLSRPTKLRFKQLIRSIETKEKDKLDKLRAFSFPDYRSGDIVQFKFLHSISEGKGNLYTGTVIGRTRRNTYNAAFRVLFRFCGVEVEMNVRQYSPMLSAFKLVARGSGNLRSKLFYLGKLGLTKEQLTRPIIKRTMKKRKEDQVQKKTVENFKKYTFDVARDPIIQQKV